MDHHSIYWCSRFLLFSLWFRFQVFCAMQFQSSNSHHVITMRKAVHSCLGRCNTEYSFLVKDQLCRVKYSSCSICTGKYIRSSTIHVCLGKGTRENEWNGTTENVIKFVSFCLSIISFQIIWTKNLIPINIFERIFIMLLLRYTYNLRNKNFGLTL